MTEESMPEGGRLLARSVSDLKSSNIYWVGTPVLVLVDPSDSETNKKSLSINLNDKNSVKLWVVNRLHIYISEDGVTWNHYLGSFEGCLTEHRLRTHKKWGKYRRHVPLESLPRYFVHYTSIEPNKITFGDHDKFKIQVDPVVAVYEDVKRPYPKDLKSTEFNNGIFSKGIRVLRIPSKQINYPCDEVFLLYWETVIFRDSLESKIKEFRKEKIEGTLTNNECEQSVKPLLQSKLGTLLAGMQMHSEAGFQLDIPNQLPKEDEHCFLYGISRDVMQKTGQSVKGSKTEGRIELRKMSAPLDSTRKGTQTKPNNLFKTFSYEIFLKWFFLEIKDALAPVIDKKPPETGYPWEVNKQTEFTKFLLENSATTKNYDEETLAKFLVEKVNSTLKQMYPDPWDPKAPPDPTAKFLSLAFQVGIASDSDECAMLAFNSIAAQTKLSISSSSIDLLKEGSGDDYLYAIKRVYFATGSDGFSDDMVPKHVYFQLKGWWQKLNDINPNEIEELKNSKEIEVIGFSSRFTTEINQADNERLRKDRAWKTAMSLKLLLEDKGLTAEVTDSPGTVKSGVKIYYRGAPLDKYPGDSLFSKYEVSFVEDVIDVSKIEIPDIKTRSNSDNRYEDRVCLIVFKRPRPKVNQITKQVVETNYALTIYQYKTVFHFDKKEKRLNELVLLYACPGEFDDASL
jgi:hypothetical protein